MRRLAGVLLVVLPASVAPATQAQAQTAPAVSRIGVVLQKVGRSERAVVFAGRTFRASGLVTPYVAGQVVHLRVYRGGRLIAAKTKPVLPAGDGSVGTFSASFRTALRGRLRIGVTHDGTPQMTYAHARTPGVDVIGPSAVPGQTGYTVSVMQRLLRRRGYVPGHRGRYDDRTARAVLAFRKMSGLARTTTASHTMLRRLINGGGRFTVRFPAHGHHVEADLSHQVLALIDGGKVERLYHMSSGKPSTPTVLGHFRVYSKTPGTNSHGMIHSSYFIGGYAVHGYESVPTYPASHGCLRVPPADAWSIYSWIGMGDRVDVYYRSGRHRSGDPDAKVGP